MRHRGPEFQRCFLSTNRISRPRGPNICLTQCFRIIHRNTRTRPTPRYNTFAALYITRSLALMSNTHGTGPASEKPLSNRGPTIRRIRKPGVPTSERVVCRSMALGSVKHPLVNLPKSVRFHTHDPVRGSRCESRSHLPFNVEHNSDVSLVEWVVLFNTITTITPFLLSNREMTALAGSGESHRVPRSSNPTLCSRAVCDGVDTVLALICVLWPDAPRSMAIPSPISCKFLRGFF